MGKHLPPCQLALPSLVSERRLELLEVPDVVAAVFLLVVLALDEVRVNYLDHGDFLAGAASGEHECLASYRHYSHFSTFPATSFGTGVFLSSLVTVSRIFCESLLGL